MPRLIVLLSLFSFICAAQDQLQQRREDKPSERARWFYSQRMYPSGSIPPNARRSAMAQIDAIDLAARAQRQLARTAAKGAVPFALATDSVNWTAIGPRPTNPGTSATSGRVNAIAIDPRDNNVVYIGAAEGGVWKTTDGGVTWTPLTDNQPSLANGGIAIDPNSPDTLYVGTGEENFAYDSYYGAGILKSTNAGASWTVIPGPFAAARDSVGAIAVSPTNSQLVVCVSRAGGWRSTDAGATWTNVLTGAPGISVVFDPTNGSSVYATLGNISGSSRNGVYHSSDGGATWTALTGAGATALPTTNVGRIELALAPSAPSTLFVQIQNVSTDGLLGIYKSTDAGTTWTRLNTTALASGWGTQMWYDNTIRVSPRDPNLVWSGGVNLFRSLDGGITWAQVPATDATGATIHVDHHNLAFTLDGAKLYIGNDGGVYSTTDVSGTRPAWSDLNATLGITQFYPGFQMDTFASATSVGGTQDNSTQWFDGNGHWTTVTCGDGGYTAIDPAAPAVAYSACQNISVGRTTSLGASSLWLPVVYGIDQSDDHQFISPMVMDPSAPQNLYFGTFRVWQTRDSGGMWSAISPDLTNVARGNGSSPTIKTVVVAPSDSNTVYAGTTNSHLAVTTNALLGANATWVDRSPGALRTITKIVVDPLNAATAYATYSGFPSATDLQGHVFKTTNAGATWTDISGNLPPIPVNDLVVDADVPDTLYIGTDAGVMVTTDGGNTWSSLGNGLPKVVVHALALQRRGRVLRAATHGRSVWEIAVPLSAPSLQPQVDSLSPATVETNSGAFTLSLTGSNFVPGTVVRWNGQNRTTTFVDSSHVTAPIPAGDVSVPGRASITAFNASTGAGSSNAKNFNIGSAPQSSSAAFVNAAYPAAPPQLAPRSIGSLYGTNLAGATEVSGAAPLPVTLGGTSLVMVLNGLTNPLPLFFVSPGQINFQVPQITVTGPTTGTLTITQGLQSTTIPVVMRPYAPALFTTNGGGTGQASTVIAGTATLAAKVGTTPDSRPAKPGEYISIYCTGLGAANNQPALGAASPSNPLATTQATPIVTIGGVQALVQFSGLAPGFVGLYQVNVQVPNGVTAGDQVPVSMTIGGVASNLATIAVAAQ
jgi:uncharacterized protein (TIGR03437 family)